MRIVNRIPLDRLWDQSGDIVATRGRYLSLTALKELLKANRLTFYVADIGHPLRRIGEADCFDFWKTEVKARLVNDPEVGFYLQDYPDEYAYLATEWSSGAATPIVLLEKYH